MFRLITIHRSLPSALYFLLDDLSCLHPTRIIRQAGTALIARHRSTSPFARPSLFNFPSFARQVVAEDKDAGVNGVIYYSLADHNAEFDIDAASGEITTATRLRGEVGALYRLTVVAHDRGSPSKSSTGFVEVRTSSAQVASLHFENSTYSVYIPEHSDVDTVITKVCGSWLGSRSSL